jgi:dipeptidyl aminopeptidase/acylaminoacyl peptidase
MNNYVIYYLIILLVSTSMITAQDISDNNIDFQTTEISIGDKTIPAIYAAPNNSEPEKLIFLLHGYASNKESNTNEIKQLASAGFDVLAIDAPHHGKRDQSKLQEVQTSGEGFVPFMLDVVTEQAEEISLLLDLYSQWKYKKFIVAGVSMGGISAYYSAMVEPRLKYVIPILGSPDWQMFGDTLDQKYLKLNPADQLEKFKNSNILTINAGKDINVPGSYSRQFIEELKISYPEGNFTYLEYPESEHFMRGEDWTDLWKQVISWLNKNI